MEAETIGGLFHSAVFDGAWDEALQVLANACGGNAAQLIGVGPQSAIAFNRAVGLPVEGLERFIEMDGGNPRRNARVRAGLSGPVLAALTEADFGDLDQILRTELYAELLTPIDIPYNIQTTLMRGQAGLVGMAVNYSARHGLPDEEERAVFEAVAPYVQAAARLQFTLEGHGAAVLTGALESMQAAAFICTADGRVLNLTAGAEALVRRQAHLVTSAGRLQPALAQDAPAFAAALRRAALRPPIQSISTEIGLRSPGDGSLLVCQVAGLPRHQFPFGLGASVLVTARTPRDRGRLAPLLQQAYGLTPAECEVAIAVAKGCGPAEIARQRGVSQGTVRQQLKVAAAKLGVSRQSEIAAKLADL